MKNQWFCSSILLTCKSVWQITFSGWIFYILFPQIWNQRKILRILNTHMPKKNKKIFGVIEYIYEYMLELVEYKFARNGLTNWKTFLTNVFENIIWHLFAGESHQVVKITVPYWGVHSISFGHKVFGRSLSILCTSCIGEMSGCTVNDMRGESLYSPVYALVLFSSIPVHSGLKLKRILCISGF